MHATTPGRNFDCPQCSVAFAQRIRSKSDATKYSPQSITIPASVSMKKIQQDDSCQKNCDYCDSKTKTKSKKIIEIKKSKLLIYIHTQQDYTTQVYESTAAPWYDCVDVVALWRIMLHLDYRYYCVSKAFLFINTHFIYFHIHSMLSSLLMNDRKNRELFYLCTKSSQAWSILE